MGKHPGQRSDQGSIASLADFAAASRGGDCLLLAAAGAGRDAACCPTGSGLLDDFAGAVTAKTAAPRGACRLWIRRQRIVAGWPLPV